MKKIILSIAAAGLAVGSLQAGTFSLSAPLTTDAASGIATSNTYTHAVSGGLAATVNGVVFAEQNATSTLANFTWTSPTKSVVLNNAGTWVAATGGVTGSGLISLLNSFTYAGGGADPGATQKFSLLGLTVGQTYDTRLYIRMWDTGGSGRPIDFKYTHGSETDSVAGLEDRPGTVLGTGNNNEAYYLNYRFTAKATTLDIDATVPAAALAGSGSFHMFGVTNQVVPEPSSMTLALGLGLIGLARRRR
jgi:hypothetical protein